MLRVEGLPREEDFHIHQKFPLTGYSKFTRIDDASYRALQGARDSGGGAGTSSAGDVAL